MNRSSYADPQLCYLDVAPTSPNENTILRGGVVTFNIVDGCVFASVDALLEYLTKYHTHPEGRLVVEWVVEHDEWRLAKNRLTSSRVIGRTAMVNGKLEVKS